MGPAVLFRDNIIFRSPFVVAFVLGLAFLILLLTFRSSADLNIDLSGGSTLNLSDFIVETAEVDLSSASEATLNVQERIDPVEVSGASRLRYLGDPSLGDVSTSGASTVDKIGD